MKVQFQILLFMVCLNLATGLIMELGLPGTEYVQGTKPSDASDYEEHFNATETAEAWRATPYSGIPIIGDVFSAFQIMWRSIQYLVVGFPLFLYWVGDNFIIDASARASFNVIVVTLVAIEGILITFFIIEFVSGRIIAD